MAEEIKILGFAGSLRRGYYNKAILGAAAELVPQGAGLEIFDLEGIPPFNQDLEQNMPERAKEFKTRVRMADAILFVTPENNYSVPAVLTNAIAWASRPYGDNAFDGKPAAIMSASIGMLGGARAQYHLRQMLVFLNIYPVNRPEVLVANAAEKIDEQGRLRDEKTKEFIKGLLEALVSWTKKLQ